jgi:NADH-quinone oxidoreductase subunit J
MVRGHGVSETAFYALAIPTLMAASGVLFLRNPVHCALSLVAALFLIAMNYVALGAHLIAALQIVVYAGAVMVLFLFVIMLLNLQTDPDEISHPLMKAGAAAAAFAIAGFLGTAFIRWFESAPAAAELPSGFGTTIVVARNLFTEHVVAFELTSILLLVAVVGAVVLAKRDRD